MRRTVFVLLLAMLAACGGSNPVSAPPPPPPPPPPPSPPGAPASVAINAGDGQTAAPNGKVVLKPSVVVRDASSRPVPSVSVTFAVDAGGGHVDGGSVVTDASGVAAIGDWTLGPTEGVNRLRVTSGALTPVVFTASAEFPLVVLADTTIGAGGGTILFQQPGDPLNGTRLVIPPGAFPTSGHWRLESRSPSIAPKPMLGRVVAPILQVFTDQGLSDSTILLTLPISVPADSFLTLFLRDPATGRMEALTPAAIGPTSITVATRHFSAGRLFGPGAPSGAPPVATAARADALLQVLGTASSLASLSSGITTPFRPGTDDWEFPNNATYLTPFGSRMGSSLSALYYFQTNGSQIFGLWGKFDQGPFWADDAQGVRVTAVAEGAFDASAATRFYVKVQQTAASAGFTADGANFFTIASAMANTRQPQLIVGVGPQSEFYSLIAYQIDPSGITAADPNRPGVPVRIPFASGRFQSIQLGSSSGAPTSQIFLTQTVGASSVLNASTMATLFSKALAGTAGNTEFPPYRLQYYDEETTNWFDLPAGTLQVSWQDVSLRAICTSCAKEIVNATLVNGLQGLDIYNGAASQLATDRTAGFAKFRVPAGGKVGVHVLGGLKQCSSCAVEWQHIDFKYITIQPTRFVISPDPLAGQVNVPATLTVRNLDPGTPVGAIYQWDFGNGTTATVVGDSTVTKSWPVAGTYPVKVVIKNPSTNQTYGRASSVASINTALPIWRFTTMTETVQGVTAPDALGTLSQYVNADINSLIEPIWAVPRTGRLFVFTDPVTAGSQTFRAGVYVMGGYGSDADNQFNPARSFAPLARTRLAPYVDIYDDDLVLDEATHTQTFDLNSGTFSGKSATRTRDLSGFPGVGGVHTVSHWEFTGTKNGTQLTGKITYFLEQWVLNPATCSPPGSLNCQGAFGGVLKWEFPFTAVRVQ